MNTRKLFLQFFSVALCMQSYAQNKPFLDDLPWYIDNLSVYEKGQEEGRAWYMPEKSMLLNGKWKFFWCDTPEAIPAKFFSPRFSDRKWGSITVPSNWEMQGYGDKLFRNVSAPFRVDPPHAPKDYNPTGLYRRTFRVPDSWNDSEQVFLRFEKVASASFVWVNGHEVGYNEGAQEPAEYNITPFLKRGENTLAVCVMKYSDGYYLESQDYWRLAGIFDDVWLYATPSVRIFDWQVITDFDNAYTDSKLNVRVKIKDYLNTQSGKYGLKACLKDKAGKTVCNFSTVPFNMEAVEKTVQLHAEIKNPLKWTAETPNLYTLALELTDDVGALKDRIETVVGFKKTEIKNGVFYLNGIPLKVNAQNSHMQHPDKGHVMDEATIRKDFELLKQFNFNAVRTSHYPPVNRYLELANEYGLYVIDEVGDEAHASEWVCDLPEYEAMYRERCRRMVLRDRNYPCILFWSAGNESGEGVNITHVINEGKALDPTRYWMYGGNAFSHPAEDIIGPRYPTPMELEMQVGLATGENTRPSFMDEYLSVAGNGGGALDDYWNVIYRHPRLMGGAIWDFVSPGLNERIRRVDDLSLFHTPTHLMGNASLVKEGRNTVLDLNGHDQWVEVYRADNVELDDNELTLTCKVFPRKLVSSCGSFITKGNNQFGLEQRGKDKLEFYIYTDKRHSVVATLPANWEYRWHRVTATYDGKRIALYIDGEEKGAVQVSGNIRNFPYPVNIGRNAELHGQETSVYICDAQIDDVGIFDKAFDGHFCPEKAALWLDFEHCTENGAFYSYGIGARTYGSIWPDRRVQPEMWQMKKTGQPLSFFMVDVTEGVVELWNRNHFTSAAQYDIRWELKEDDKVIQSGGLALATAPQNRELVHIPYKKPVVMPGKEYRLMFHATLKKDELWAKAGHEVAWEQIELPWNQPCIDEKTCLSVPSCIQTDSEVIVSGEGFRYSFNRSSGQLVSMVVQGTEMLKSPLQLNLWRAPLANELDNWNASTARSSNWKDGYGYTVATEMYSTGIDCLTHQPLSFSVSETAGTVHVRIVDIELIDKGEKEKKDLYIEGVRNNGIISQYDYIINGEGTIEIHHILKPEGQMPLWFPRVGLTLTVNDALDHVKWYGRGPQENYPDRKTGYPIGIYKSTVHDMYEPYLMPQDYGLRTDVRWLQLTTDKGIGMQFRMNEYFNFNIYPYSTDNLTKAMYTYQLQEQDGMTLNLDYVTSGVGCTARGIFSSYRAMPQEYRRKITIKPLMR